MYWRIYKTDIVSLLTLMVRAVSRQKNLVRHLSWSSSFGFATFISYSLWRMVKLIMLSQKQCLRSSSGRSMSTFCLWASKLTSYSLFPNSSYANSFRVCTFKSYCCSYSPTKSSFCINNSSKLSNSLNRSLDEIFSGVSFSFLMSFTMEVNYYSGSCASVIEFD